MSPYRLEESSAESIALLANPPTQTSLFEPRAETAWREARPCANCLKTARHASCPRNERASCRGRRRCRARLYSAQRPCRGTTDAIPAERDQRVSAKREKRANAGAKPERGRRHKSTRNGDRTRALRASADPDHDARAGDRPANPRASPQVDQHFSPLRPPQR